MMQIWTAGERTGSGGREGRESVGGRGSREMEDEERVEGEGGR